MNYQLQVLKTALGECTPINVFPYCTLDGCDYFPTIASKLRLLKAIRTMAERISFAAYKARERLAKYEQNAPLLAACNELEAAQIIVEPLKEAGNNTDAPFIGWQVRICDEIAELAGIPCIIKVSYK